ncbi:MAG TPA: sensor histidine kinase [Bryobacteraceae bacterium]|nr:sensor histidine kinase [Bryobacteraceae bacterium]
MNPRPAETIPLPKEDKTNSQEPVASSRLRWLFLGVCGFLLALLGLSGVLAVRLLGQMHAQELAVTHALGERAQMLSDLLFSVQKYNQAVQQLVAETKADQEQASRRRLDQLAFEIESDLRQYPLARDSGEAALLDGLENVFSEQRTLYISVLAAPPDERKQQSQVLIAQHMNRLQGQLADWSARLKTWNGERLQQADSSLTSEFASVQHGLTRVLAIGFGSGFLLVLASMAYIVRLERQTRRRYLQLSQSQHEMQQLSARLVDAQETERRNISRELHDEVGQSLGALLVDVGRLSGLLSHDRPEVRSQLDNMKAVTERTFQEVRNIALLLRPSMLDDLGLVAALEWQGREVSRRSDIEVEVQSDIVSDHLPDDYRVCIYRLVQEALSNAVRHSGARNAKVKVRQSEQGVRVQVTDDGRGFDPGHVRGLGLLGMEERVKRLGGTLTIESRLNHGTTLAAELPPPSRNGQGS